MRIAPLGSTDISVSQIGLGTVKFGRNQSVKYPHSFDLPTDKEIQNLLACAQDLGINLLDTAPAYGTSEERLGKILKASRSNWILSTKVGEEFVNGISTYDFSPQHIQKSIERSLSRLQTDYLDIVLVHSNGEDQKIIEQDQVFDILIEMKNKGLIRAFGMSVKTVAGGLIAAEHSDVVMVTYNPIEIDDLPIIQTAFQKQKGVLIKKALGSGHLDARTALQFVLKEPGVTSVILGTLNCQHLEENVRQISV